MNKKDREWIKSGVKLSVILAFFLSVAFTLALTTDLQRQVNDLKDFRAFELEKYNFTEEECVENKLPENTTIVAPKSKDGYWVYCTTVTTSAGSSNYCGLTKENPSPCTLYCHQTQVEIGKECRNETTYSFCIGKKQANCKQINDTYSCYVNWVSDSCKAGEWNETVCTPTYRTERGFCATAEEIEKAKELGR